MVMSVGAVVGSVLIALTSFIQCKELVKVETIPNYPGMYFVPQYWFTISSETWSVLYNIPLSPVETRIKLIDEIWRELQVTKSNNTLMYWSNPRYELLEHSIVRLHTSYEQFQKLLGHPKKTKRGLFNSFGRFIKTITGNMDADDEEYYDEKINTIALDNKRIYQLEKDQLTIIQSTLWAVNKTTLEMQENENILSKSYQ